MLANLLRPLLLRLARPASTASRPRALIASGLLRAEADEVAAAFAAPRAARARAGATDGEWAALLLAAPRA